MSEPYPFYAEMSVRFRDLDAMGHVNNAVYFTYMESARSAYFHALFAIDSPEALPVIVGEATCRYRAPLHYGEKVRVGIGVSRFGSKSFDFVYRIEGEDARLAAIGRTAMVMYDYKKAMTYPISDSFKERILDHQGDWRPPDTVASQ